MTVFVSVSSLAVSIYGIVERQLVLRKTERVRLTEVVDQLTEIDIAESKEREIDANWFVRRKEVLVQQAVSLLGTPGQVGAPRIHDAMPVQPAGSARPMAWLPQTLSNGDPPSVTSDRCAGP